MSSSKPLRRALSALSAGVIFFLPIVCRGTTSGTMRETTATTDRGGTSRRLRKQAASNSGGSKLTGNERRHLEACMEKEKGWESKSRANEGRSRKCGRR